MPADRGFAGPWAHLFEEFIAFKRSLGYLLGEDLVRKYRLLSRHIAAFPADPRVLTAEMVEAFLDPGGRTPGTVWVRRNIVKQFALFLHGRGIDCWQPPERFDAIPAPRFDPRIITSQEMATVIAVADAMPPSPSSPCGAAIYGMLLRMLWCCGLRIGEALQLRVGDVDLDAAVITVGKAKGDKTRLVPMSGSLTGHARRYVDQLGLGAQDPQAFFYRSARCGHYQPSSVLRRVQSFMLQAGITIDGVRPPRLHDIRHSFAVAALAKMHADGMDIYTCLPLLAHVPGTLHNRGYRVLPTSEWPDRGPARRRQHDRASRALPDGGGLTWPRSWPARTSQPCWRPS